jgi:hypothetical protein
VRCFRFILDQQYFRSTGSIHCLLSYLFRDLLTRIIAMTFLPNLATLNLGSSVSATDQTDLTGVRRRKIRF